MRDDEGAPRAVAKMPGDGPTWVSGDVALPDKSGKEHLVATYAKINGDMSPYEFGLVEWNDKTENFEKALTFWKKTDGGDHPPKPSPDGHPVISKDANGKSSVFGEVWYLEGKSPEGPWGPAVKVLTHDNYTFYNVQIGWQLTSPDDPIHLFEGTYTTSFTNNKIKTPHYEYNQILYRLDLDDPALKPAQQDQPNNNTKSKYPHVQTNRNR